MKTNFSASLTDKNGRFYVIISYKENGKQCYKWLKTGLQVKGNKKKANQMKEHFLAEYKATAEEENELQGWDVDMAIKDMLFSDLLLQWQQRKRLEVSLSTQQGYETILRYAVPYFKKLHVQVKHVTPIMLEKYYISLLEKKPRPMSPNTVRKHAVLFKSVFRELVENGQLTRNPAKKAKTPKTVAYNSEVYSAEELNRLFQAMKGHSLEDVVIIAAFYGLRRSEICGLRWQDIDFNQNCLYVRHKVVQAHVDGKKTVLKSNELKTASSRRAFPLLPEIKERLMQRKAKVEENRRIFGNCYDETNLEYVFVEPDGRLLEPERISNRFRSFMKYHPNLPKIRFHDLRHSCATLLLSKGFSLREIQEYMGHATIVTTTRYTHTNSASKEKALAAIEEAITFASKNDEFVQK